MCQEQKLAPDRFRKFGNSIYKLKMLPTRVRGLRNISHKNRNNIVTYPNNLNHYSLLNLKKKILPRVSEQDCNFKKFRTM